jgi:hypothetical protein
MRSRNSQEEEPEFVVRPLPNENRSIVNRFELRGLSEHSIQNILEYFVSKSELFLEESCKHLLDKEYKR